MIVVYNDDTGKIISITPSIDNTLQEKSYITVTLDEVIHILEGKESIYWYHVFYNPKTKEREFGLIENYNEYELDINEIIYEIPNVDDNDAEIIVKQDLINTCWKIFPSKNFANKLIAQHINVKGNLYFSITEPGNPNILYRQFTVDLPKMLQEHYYIVPFKQKFEFKGDVISIYTNKRFSSYSYKKIQK